MINKQQISASKPKRKQAVAIVLLLIALLVLCITPMASDLYRYNRNHVSVEPVSIQYVSVKNTLVTQSIYCQGYISQLGIAFYAPSGALYGDAIVNISVSQADVTVSENVRAADLRIRSSYKRDNDTMREENEYEEMTYQMRSGLWGISQGTAIVTITSTNLPSGTDLFCKVSSTKISGLPAAKAGDNNLGKPLVLSYNQFRINAHFWYETVLLAFLVLLLFFTSWLLVYKNEWLKQRNILFWCAFAVIFIVVSIRNPYASFWGEPRSEAAYEFWYKAKNTGFLGSLMSPMSGEALAWWERILMSITTSLFPTKYIFTAAQLIELTTISLLTAIPCLNAFRRYFRDEPRLLFSILLGTALLFDSAYYFWSCSYWALLFFILFPLLPLEKLHKTTYIAGLILAAILCVSRIYHVLLIPVALVLLIVLGKKRGRRFTLYCVIIALASLFEGVYSLFFTENLAAGSSVLSNLQNIGIGRLLNNTLYYQVQVIVSFFTGATHWSGSGTNVLGLLFIALIIGVFVTCILRKQHEVASFLGAMGFISLSSIAVIVFVSGSYAEVFLPINYASIIHWGENYYQEADLHFVYAYICLAFILATLFYLGKREWEKRIEENVCPSQKSKAVTMKANAVFLVTAVLCCSIASCAVQPRLSYDRIVVEWKSIWQVTQQEKYFAAINMFYRAAPISLEQGTDEMIFGVDKNGTLFQWNYGSPRYEMDYPYHIADVGEISVIGNKEVLSITARRALINFDSVYVAVLYDADGYELARSSQAETDGRWWLNFIFTQPVRGVYSVSFELSDGRPAYVQDAIQVGYIR